jgi:phenylacetate-CoA ligase
MTATSTAASSDQTDRLRALAGEQLARDHWPRDRLQAWQGERLRSLLRHAATASPYYREVLGPDAATGDVPLAELPTLPKATLMDNFDRIVTDPRLRRTEVEAHLTGADPGRPLLGRYRVLPPPAPPACAACSSTATRSSPPGSPPACAAWPAGA